MITLRPFQQEDWGSLLALANQAAPFAPAGNITWLEKRKAFDESQRGRRHFIAAEDGLPVGYGCIEQQGDDPGWWRVFVVCSPEKLSSEVGARLYEHVLQSAGEAGAQHLWAREYQEDRPIRTFFIEHGFVETQRFKPPDEGPMVVFQLDLT